MASEQVPSITWLGHASLLLTTSTGARLAIDPWLEGNPSLPDEWRTLDGLDGVLVTHGHFDHLTDVANVARANSVPTVSNPEIAAYLATQGVEERIEMNKGGTIELAGVRLTMVSADHSSGITVGEGQPMIEGGEPAGLILRASDMPTLYVAGDTGVFGDMALIGELYAPSVGVLPVEGHYNMGPFEAAHACRLLGIERVVPVHWGTFPIFTGTPERLRDELETLGVDCEVAELAPGGTLELRRDVAGT
jgi:L-ascorbate metabolism protein UlaG (beta-lactamase superfamily)